MNAMPGGGEFGRGARVDVRNPIILLPEAQALIASMTPVQRRHFGDLMRRIAAEADKNAHRAWSQRKGPMAAYWRSTCTCAKHLARAIDPRTCAKPKPITQSLNAAFDESMRSVRAERKAAA